MNIRATYAAFRQQMTHFLSDPQWIIPSLIAPFMFTIVTLMIFKDVDGPVVLQAVLGGGVLGMWGNTLYSSGWSISYDRYNGTLEPLMVSPTNLMDVVTGRSIWNTLIGLSNAVLVFIVAELMFQTGIGLANPGQFFVILILTLASLASIGLIFSAFFVLTRASSVLMSSLEFPIYVVSGAMFPISILPGWVMPISFILAPSWGVDAMKIVALDGYTGLGMGVMGSIAIMFALTIVYVFLAKWLFRKIERNVRSHGNIGRF